MSQADFNREVKRLTVLANDEAFTHTASNEAVLVEETASIESSNYKECIVLTISSQVFRLITIVHLNNDSSSKKFVSEAIKSTVASIDDEAFYDYMGELGNTLCGSIKRHLNKFVPSLGMSTPHRLNAECLKFIESQLPSYAQHSVVSSGEAELFATSVYLCADQELNYEIPIVRALEQAEECGELEFF